VAIAPRDERPAAVEPQPTPLAEEDELVLFALP
jgi:hypothetical protein